MKRTVLVLLLQAIAISGFAQNEMFVKALKKLEFNSTILDAAMLFKKDFPEFEALTNAPVMIDEFPNPYDSTQNLKIEAFYFVNKKGQELVQLYYVNDALYEKSVHWFFHKDSVEAVETKYMKCSNMFKSNPALLAAEKGKVVSEEEKYDLGARTYFPVQKTGKNIRKGETGYKLVYTRETGGRGFWVYAQSFNTYDNSLDTSMDFPHISAPAGTFDELETVLLPTAE
jgi:hypothetical protein